MRPCPWLRTCCSASGPVVAFKLLEAEGNHLVIPKRYKEEEERVNINSTLPGAPACVLVLMRLGEILVLQPKIHKYHDSTRISTAGTVEWNMFRETDRSLSRTTCSALRVVFPCRSQQCGAC